MPIASTASTTSTASITQPTLAIIGAGPAGLMAALTAAQAGVSNIHVYDAMPSAGRKFLLAGIGGLNLTHSEPKAQFIQRYTAASSHIAHWLGADTGMDAAALRQWCQSLGIDTFVGSSGRVFPTGMKAAPLLRAWLSLLRQLGVTLHSRHRWQGFSSAGGLRMQSPQGEFTLTPQATVLALGGASWSRLGSDGAWLPWLVSQGVAVSPFAPANCGFNVVWSPHMIAKCAGQALKNIAYQGQVGECLLTTHGIEGSLIYAHSRNLREHIAQHGHAVLTLDLAPQHSLTHINLALAHPRGARSVSGHLQSRLGIAGARAVLLRECLPKTAFEHMPSLAAGIKACPIVLTSPRPIDEAISTAGGVELSAVDVQGRLKALPNIWLAGEMLDWEAPTGGYLLTACIASGKAAGAGVAQWLVQ